MESIKNRANQLYMAVATPFVGVLKDSKFLEKGVLTPQEFVLAGDQLTYKCQTWSWEGGVDKLKNKNLPEDKQFLITRNVPCSRRIKDLQQNEHKEREMEDGWVATDNPNHKEGQNQKKAETVDIDEIGDAQDIDAIDMDQQQQEAMDIDDIKENQDEEQNIFASNNYVVKNEPEDTVDKVRSYDLSITYDFFYQTPRLWLLGYNENGQLLKEEEVFQDVMADYANKTVTIENHPHLGIKEASIHPCNHAKVMKKIIDTIQSNGGTPQVHQSLFVFLKFISSVVPTIEYDFTIDLELE